MEGAADDIASFEAERLALPRKVDWGISEVLPSFQEMITLP
jgi:hypothetical protein